MKEMALAHLVVTMSAVLKKIRVLCVDDCSGLLCLCKAALEARGHEVFTSSDGLDAVEILWKQAIDIAVIDNEMAEMSGMELAQVMKETNRNIAILIYSATPPEQSNEADLLVNKADGPHELVQAICRIASGLMREARSYSQAQPPCLCTGSYLFAAWKIIGSE